MGSTKTASYLLFACFGACVLAEVFAEDVVAVEANCPNQGFVFEHGSQTEIVKPIRTIHYACHFGYHLVGNHTQTCGPDGQWVPPEKPQCISTVCTFMPTVLNAEVNLDHGRTFNSQEGDEGTVTCMNGYLSTDESKSYRIVCNKYGFWTTLSGSPLQQCEKVNCPVPPTVPNALYTYDTENLSLDQLGQKVRYTCIKGFEMVDDSAEAVLTCKDGDWDGPIPTCVHPEYCTTPISFFRGKWRPKTQTIVDDYFPVGSEVQYYCDVGYRLAGAEVLKCTSDRLWSKIPPICIQDSEKIYFCHNIGLDKIDHGYCKCERSDSNSLEKCEPFFRGTQVRCGCDSGYKLMGSSLLTCTSLPLERNEYGTWNHEPPYCIRDDSKTMSAPALPGRDEDDLSSKLVSGTQVSTLVIVIATACSVLGVLMLIMVVVVFRRKKPRPRLFHPSAVTPPPYSRVTNQGGGTLDEHDRLALMAYADATRVHLPTYEEAVQGSRGGGHSVRGMVSPGDYRPLPSIPPNLRAAGSITGGGAENPNRHSTVTTSTMNRDGLSENFGSLDTVNVSVSDASTSVTVETFDSGTSNRSMSSQRATAGSIASSEDNLANDNAPLLDNSGDPCEDNPSDCDTTNLDQKDE